MVTRHSTAEPRLRLAAGKRSRRKVETAPPAPIRRETRRSATPAAHTAFADEVRALVDVYHEQTTMDPGSRGILYSFLDDRFGGTTKTVYFDEGEWTPRDFRGVRSREAAAAKVSGRVRRVDVRGYGSVAFPAADERQPECECDCHRKAA